MSDIERKARELLAAELKEHCPAYARAVIEAPTLNGVPSHISAGVRAIIAALTPPDGYVLVPVKITKEIEDVLNESFEYGYSAESTWDLAIHASSQEGK
jgi:hypothetical protein